VAHGAGLQVIGRALDHPFVGRLLALPLLISFVTETAAHAEVGVPLHESPVHDISLVHLIRLNWRRRPCSPFALFTTGDNRRFVEGFHEGFVGVALDTTAGVGNHIGREEKKEDKGR
jgi:hypothetical protein